MAKKRTIAPGKAAKLELLLVKGPSFARLNAAKKVVDTEIGEHLLEVMDRDPDYVPTIRNHKVARALKVLGRKCWNSRTGKNW